MRGRADVQDEIAADIASQGFAEITEPRPRDYEYIAQKVADNVFPISRLPQRARSA